LILAEKLEIINGELIRKIKSGDQGAFELLFRLLHKKLCSYAYIYVRNYDVSDEIIQETFIKIWETREALREDQSVRAFLYRCVHNNCINYLKKKSVTIRLSEKYNHEFKVSAPVGEPDFNEELIEKLELENLETRLRLAIDELPDQCKEIFLLSRFNDLTYQEIAEKIGISVNTVKTQISRAFQKIRTEINKSDLI